MAVGFAFTGKTWCNYVCPVSFVEKLYTEPRGLRDTPNSQCATCTACKPACPDINEENSYWKEILAPAKARAYYAFPGVVLAFYTYYYLQAGTWAYYFGGAWTNQAGLIRTAFLPGHDAMTAGFFFLPRRAARRGRGRHAGGRSAISLLTLSAVEPRLGAALRTHGVAIDAAGLRSTMFTIAAFIAFVSFYSFAGAPTLRLVPGLPHIFQCSSSRRRRSFWSDASDGVRARSPRRRWRGGSSRTGSGRTPPPRNLREAFLIHTVRSQSHEEGASACSSCTSPLRDSLQSGVVSRGEVHRLESLRSQMGIAAADHERVMAELADEQAVWRRPRPGSRRLKSNCSSRPTPQRSPSISSGSTTATAHRRRVRPRPEAAVQVTAEEHGAVLDGLLRRQDGIGAHLADVPATIEWAAEAVNALDARAFLRLAVPRQAVATPLVQGRRLAGTGAWIGRRRDGAQRGRPDWPRRRCARRLLNVVGAGLAGGGRTPGRFARTGTADIGPAPDSRACCARSSPARTPTCARRPSICSIMDAATEADRLTSRRRRAPGRARNRLRRPGGTILGTVLRAGHPREDDRPGADWPVRRPRPGRSGRARACGHRAVYRQQEQMLSAPVTPATKPSSFLTARCRCCTLTGPSRTSKGPEAASASWRCSTRRREKLP